MGSSNFNMRLEDDLRTRVSPILEQYGLTPSQAVRMFFNQIASTGKIPLTFDWANPEPNAVTRKAIEEAEAEFATAERYKTVDEAIQAMQELAR
jgi:addiction module antitoxin, relB/dinJ family